MRNGASKNLEVVVNKFVGEVVDLVENIQADRLTSALGSVSAKLRDNLPEKGGEGRTAAGSQPGKAASGGSVRPSAKQKSAINSSRAKKAAETSTPKKGGPAEAPKAVTKSGAKKVPSTPISSPTGKPKPAVERKKGTSPAKSREHAERDAAALEAVRVLGQPTAAEVANHCKVGKTTAYMGLQDLVEARRVAITRQGRVIRYSLASSSGGKSASKKRSSTPKTKANDASEPGVNSTPKSFVE